MTPSGAPRSTRWMMSSSAIAAGIAAVVLLFAPHELLAFAGFEVTDGLAAGAQLWSGALGGFALVNWMARENLIGGIYNRPLLVANVFHSVVGATTLGRLAAAGGSPAAIGGAAVFTAFAVWFGLTLFRSPV